MKWREQSQLLIKKADEDLHILRTHRDDARVSDEMWGFHAEQAVEKLIKSLLSHRQVSYPFTHRLRELADLIADSGTALPSDFDLLLDLTPYAAELRYSMLPREETDAPLDRNGLLGLAESLREHVCKIIGAT